MGFWPQHQSSLVYFVLVLVLIAMSNALTLRRLGKYPKPPQLPRVSILVPARNEEENIRQCVPLLLAQNYPDFQLLVLNDHSTDGTEQTLAALAADDSRLQVLQGEPLPAGWLGKHWACHQLVQAADGELLLFTDADTRHYNPYTLRDSVAALLAEKADLLSAFVQEEVLSWAERLTVPVISWSILSFLPIWLAERLRLSPLSAANGQFMLFRRSAYVQIGGHAAVRENAVDDIALGRRIAGHGLRWRMVDALDYVCCRMYCSFPQVFEGFSKNLFAFFEYNAPICTFIWTWLGVVFVEPLVLVLLHLTRVPISHVSMPLAIAAIGCSLVLWGISNWRCRFPLYLTILYPLSISLFGTAALWSMILTPLGRVRWKGRTLVKQRIRLW